MMRLLSIASNAIWDPSSRIRVMEKGGSTTLMIPSIFVGWNGAALDYKVLHRRDTHVCKHARAPVLLDDPHSLASDWRACRYAGATVAQRGGAREGDAQAHGHDRCRGPYDRVGRLRLGARVLPGASSHALRATGRSAPSWRARRVPQHCASRLILQDSIAYISVGRSGAHTHTGRQHGCAVAS